MSPANCARSVQPENSTWPATRTATASRTSPSGQTSSLRRATCCLAEGLAAKASSKRDSPLRLSGIEPLSRDEHFVVPPFRRESNSGNLSPHLRAGMIQDENLKPTL